MEEIIREVPADILRRVIEEQYAATPAQLRSLQQNAEARSGTPASQYRNFGFNPLSSRPVVTGLAGGGLFIPVPGDPSDSHDSPLNVLTWAGMPEYVISSDTYWMHHGTRRIA